MAMGWTCAIRRTALECRAVAPGARRALNDGGARRKLGFGQEE